MVKKTQLFLNIFLVILIVVGIVYGIVSSIVKSFSKKDILNISEYKGYMTEENLVTDYSMFSALDSITINFIHSCSGEKYNELYKLIDSRYVKQYEKEDVINTLKKYKQDYFLDSDEFALRGKLIKAYSVKDFSAYILEIKSYDKTLNLIVFPSTSDLTYTIALVI